MAKIKIDTEEAEGSIQNLQKEMRVLLRELQSVDAASDEFAALAEKTGELQDQINNASEAARANAGPAFERLGNNFGLVSQKLMALDFEGAAESMKGLAGSIKNISFKDIIAGIKGFGTTLANVGKALMTNPIFLIAGAIAAAYFAIEAYSKAQEEKLNAYILRIDAKIKQYKREQEIEVAQAASNAEKIYEVNKHYRDKEIKDVSDQIDKLRSFNLGRNGLNEEQKKSLESLTDKYRDLLKEQEIAEINHTNVISAERTKQLSNYYNFTKSIEGQLNNFNLSERENEKIQAQERYKANLKSLNENKDSNERYREDLKKINEIRNLEIAAIDKKYNDEARKKREEEAIKAEEERRKNATAANNAMRIERKTNSDSLHLETKQANDSLLKLDKDFKSALLVQDDKYLEERRLKRALARDSELQMAQDAVNSLMMLNDALTNGSEKSARKSFAVNKALSLAQAIISTYQAVNAQLAVPQDALTGANFVKAGIALTAGLANVIKIQKTRFGSSGGVSSSSASPISSAAGSNQSSTSPAFNVLDTGFLNNRPGQNNPVQAYVLSSNVSSQMEATQKIQSLSAL